MARNKRAYNSAAVRAEHSNTLNQQRRRNTQRLAVQHAPTGVRISQRRAKGCTPATTSHSAAEIREAMRAPSHVGTNRVAKNGCTTHNVMNEALWRRERHHTYGGGKK